MKKVRILIEHNHPETDGRTLALELVEAPADVISYSETDVSGLKFLVLESEGDVYNEFTTLTEFVIDTQLCSSPAYDRATEEHKNAYRVNGIVDNFDKQTITNIQLMKELVKEFGCEGIYWPYF